MKYDIFQVWGIKVQTSLGGAIILPTLMSKCFIKYSDSPGKERQCNYIIDNYLYVSDLTKTLITYNEII